MLKSFLILLLSLGVIFFILVLILTIIMLGSLIIEAIQNIIDFLSERYR